MSNITRIIKNRRGYIISAERNPVSRNAGLKSDNLGQEKKMRRIFTIVDICPLLWTVVQDE